MTDTPDTDRQAIAGDVVSASDVTGAWLPPAAAATRLGISERTLWRDVKAGKYHRRIVDRKALILVPDSSSDDGRQSETGLAPLPDTGATALALTEMAERLTRQANTVTRQAVQIARLTGDRQLLQSERDAAEARAADLAARLAQAEWRWWHRWTRGTKPPGW